MNEVKKLNKLFINWKYNNEIVLTTQETQFHCSIESVKIWLEQNLVKFSLLKKDGSGRQIFSFEPAEGTDKLEVWTADGKYHQHDIQLSPKI